MELLLNLMWIVVVALLGAVVSASPVRREGSAIKWLAIAGGLICVAALLFPVISMSDDLCVEYTVGESPAKHVVRVVVAQQVQDFVSTLLVLLAMIAFSRQIRRHVQQAPPTTLAGFSRPVVGRAPPCFTC